MPDIDYFQLIAEKVDRVGPRTLASMSLAVGVDPFDETTNEELTRRLNIAMSGIHNLPHDTLLELASRVSSSLNSIDSLFLGIGFSVSSTTPRKTLTVIMNGFNALRSYTHKNKGGLNNVLQSYSESHNNHVGIDQWFDSLQRPVE